MYSPSLRYFTYIFRLSFCSYSGYIELQYFGNPSFIVEFVPSEFNLPAASRTLNSTTYDVTDQKAFDSDISNYKSYAPYFSFLLDISRLLFNGFEGRT